MSSVVRYLPSVSFLMGRYGLTQETLNAIKGSGPKNRILKGDVLKYLQNYTQDYADSVENERFYSIDLDLSNLHALQQGQSDLLAIAAIRALNQVNLSSKVAQVVRQNKHGVFKALVDVTAINQKTISRLKDGDGPLNPGSFQFIDSLALGKRFETPVVHLSNGQVAVLQLSQPVQELQNDDIIDILTGSTTCSFESTYTSEEDVKEYNKIQVDLTVDERSISNKVAEKYLSTFKELVEEVPETLLK